MKDVPVLVTYDVHTHAQHSPANVERYLRYALDLHDELGFKASFFFPAEAARQMKGAVRELIQRGHQVGNHGLTHRSEYYNAMSPAEQEEKLRCATEEIEDVIGQRVTCFRAPAFKISGMTLQILETLGYEADLSVNSQRLGILSSDPWNLSWMLAPRRPYHPDRRHPWRKGDLNLWEIPLSCVLVPFMSNTALVCGGRFIRMLFLALYVEAARLRSIKPIVYMGHPEDFYADRPAPMRSGFHWKDLIPRGGQGFQIRRAFFENEPGRIATLAQGVIQTLRTAPSVRFLTVSESIDELERLP